MNKKTRAALILALSLCAALLLTGVIWSAATETTLDWYVIGGGGGRMTSGIYSLDGTIGQTVTGSSTAASYDLCAGFWCGADTAAAESTVYLPLVVRP